MPLDDVVQNFLNDPDQEENAKDDIRDLMTSHLTAGMRLQEQGLLHEAISEYAKEHNRRIRTDIDKEIVQKSYVHIGTVYRKLGEIENAKAAFSKARELWRLYGVGSAPHYDLAKIFIEQGHLDEAIEMCQELLREVPDGGVKQLLAKALAMKEGKS